MGGNLENTQNNSIISKTSNFTNTELIKKVINDVNNNRLSIISGMKHSGKLSFLQTLLTTTNSIESFYYFNKELDSENTIKTSEDINNSLNEYIKLYKKPNLIILHNTNKIENIKDFIINIFKEGYKIIIISNSFKIEGKNEFEVFPSPLNKIENNEFESILKYGKIPEILEIPKSSTKRTLLQTMVSDICLQSIFYNFSVKNVNLYNFTITYLSGNNKYFSLRELQKEIDERINISLKTTIDYIDFSLQAKIIKRVFKFDIKTNKIISSKAKYYFNDTGIRNSLSHFNLDTHTLQENLVFNELNLRGFTIYGGKNGAFEFSFIAEKKSHSNPLCPSDISPSNQGEKIYIHLSELTDRDAIKQEVRKLLKIGDTHKKYLLVNNIDELGIKKKQYDEVEILSIEEFLKTKINQA